jgi:pimeloyl-ACP methyl ester carboxylesterase
VYGIPAANVEATFRNAYANTPHINFTRIDDSFHFVMLDQPEAFATVVTDFLQP